jgi:dienelactone hydrolase
MAERIVSMHAAYKSGKEVVDGFLSRPTVGDPRTAIVLIHGYRGLDDGQRAVTRRFAQEGFVCLSPDLFHGQTFNTLDECALQKTSLDTKTEIEMFRETLDKYKKKYEIEMYDGAGHAFLNNPQTKSTVNREAAAKSVIKTSKWLRKYLA